MASEKKVEEAQAYLSVAEAASLCGVSENTVKNHRNKIVHRRRGYGSRAPIFFERESLLAWAQAYAFVKAK